MSVGVIGFEDDEDLIQRASRMQGLGGVSYATAPLQLPAPCGVSSVSSIGPASKKEFVAPQHRPLLEKPQTNIMIPLTALTLQMEDSRDKQAHLMEAEVKSTQADMAELEEQIKASLDKMANDAKSRGLWETAFTLTQYAISVGAIAVGATIGGWPSYLLIASGVIGIGNRAIHDTNLLQAAVEWYSKSEEVQKRITQNVEMGAFTLQMGLGLAGGYAAGVGPELANKISLGFGLFGAGAKVGSEFYKKKISDTTSDLTRTRYKITADNQIIEQYARDATKMIESAEIKVMQDAIRSQEVSMD